jgi:hypothetical protein
MAAAVTALTLASEAIPIIVPIIKSLVSHIGTHVSDPTALHQTVTSAVTPIVNTLSTSGILPNGIDPNTLSTVIKTFIADMSPSAPAEVPVATDGGQVLVPAGPPETPNVIQESGASAPSFPPGSKFTITGTLTLQ